MNRYTVHQHIIAIGASAGGVETLFSFFDHTPLGQVSYVVIQHLSSKHQSRLAKLLNKHSWLEICLAKHGTPLEANKVYVIPNHVFLTVRQGRLLLTNKGEMPRPHNTIDAFFISLAADHADKAIGVVLSGTGSDGSGGVKAIHQAGGWVIAQDPATARFSTMPANAIATGAVHAVLPLEAMPAAIQEHIKAKGNGQSVHQPVPEGSELSTEALEESTLVAILELIKHQLPLDFSDYKRPTIFRRIRRRIKLHQFGHPDAYLAYLQKEPAELEALAKDFLISVTTFFRDPAAFQVIERDIIPAIVGRDSDPLKIWVAGCATGEEAYSLAMLMVEYLEKTQQQREVKIFATDLDNDALAIASKGAYDAKIAQEVTPERLERFFTPEPAGFKVRYHLRKMLIFAHHDLVKNPPYCNIDLISCRNLLIYFSPTLQKKVFDLLHFGLRPDGYLFLGASENAQLLAPQLLEVDRKWRIYQKTASSRSIQFERFSLLETEERSSPAPPRPTAASAPGNTPPNRHLSESVIEALVSHYGQAGVCLDEERRVVQAFGDLTPYLLPKLFTPNLMELLPPALLVAFGTAAKRAVDSNEPVAIGGIRGAAPHEVSPHNNLHPAATVHLLVKPFLTKTGQPLLLVLLGPDSLPATGSPASEPFDVDLHTRDYVAYLEEALRESRESLQDASQKMEALGENMQSFNEELLSANEEMQSGNEELQSVNEELQTINAEYQVKIRELSDLNDDLNNYFRSNMSGQLFVDRDLRLKKFSPAAAEHINLRENDIGRPLHHLTNNIRFDTLMEDLQWVLASGETLTREVQATTERWYQVRVMPYLSHQQRQEGMMVTFYEITDLVQARKVVEESRQQAQALANELGLANGRLTRTNVDLDNFVYTASHDLRSPISTLKGLLELLSRRLVGQLDEKSGKALAMADASVVKLLGVIGDLTEIAKVQRDVDVEREPVPFRDLLNEVLADLNEPITASGARIRLHIDTEHLLYARKNLRSILYNLLSNAIKYRSDERKPEVHLTFRIVEGKPVLVVADNGLGLGPKQVAKLFSIYKRFHDHVEGTGIGLYMVKRIVDNNGGRIEVASQEGEGTTFTVHFGLTSAKGGL
ncbi:MAG: PAS domain-containing protein [Ferruginibacter sp.]|nr:PAS domain-containing protein [Cytophagales bacterium]